jgi:hypothetical protein
MVPLNVDIYLRVHTPLQCKITSLYSWDTRHCHEVILRLTSVMKLYNKIRRGEGVEVNIVTSFTNNPPSL